MQLDPAPLNFLHLSPNAQRVLGSLAEKEMTVPDTYPLTINALITAANQTTNRFPVMDLSTDDITAAVTELRVEHRLVRLIPSGAGSRVDKYRHVLEDRFGLSRPEKAILAVLLLRGPQTLGEIKIRTQRMHDFVDLGAIDQVLDRMADPTQLADASEPTDARDTGILRTASTSGAVTTFPEGYARTWQSPLIVRLPRQPGQHEPRVMHLLGGEVDATSIAMEGPSSPRQGGQTSTSSAELADRVSTLEAEVASLRIEIQSLRDLFS
jgi:uncharacterized protein